MALLAFAILAANGVTNLATGAAEGWYIISSMSWSHIKFTLPMFMCHITQTYTEDALNLWAMQSDFEMRAP